MKWRRVLGVAMAVIVSAGCSDDEARPADPSGPPTHTATEFPASGLVGTLRGTADCPILDTGTYIAGILLPEGFTTSADPDLEIRNEAGEVIAVAGNIYEIGGGQLTGGPEPCSPEIDPTFGNWFSAGDWTLCTTRQEC